MEPLNNKIKRYFWFLIPFGVVVYLLQRFGKAVDSCGTTEWCRVYSSYSDKYSGAVVLVRKPENEKGQ